LHDGLQGRQLGQVVVERDQIAGLVGAITARGEEPEADGLAEDEPEGASRDLLRDSFRCAARHDAKRARRSFRRHADVIRARAAAADAQAEAAADEPVHGRAASHREIGSVVAQAP